MKSKKYLGQHESKCPPNWSKLHPNDQNRTKESHYWSEMVQNSPIGCFKHFWIRSKWLKLAKNDQEQDFNKVHLEKWRMGIVTRLKFVTIMYNLCKIRLLHRILYNKQEKTWTNLLLLSTNHYYTTTTSQQKKPVVYKRSQFCRKIPPTS